MKQIFILINLIISIGLFSQSSNYWSTNFNTEASLLAGAVVGGNSDLTSIYYNPAGISEIENHKLAVNASLLSGSYTTYKNSLGNGIDMIDYSFVVQPRFVSYLYRSKKFKRLSWQFAIYNKAIDNTSIYNTVQYNANIMYKNNIESYNGNFDLEQRYSDYRGGIGSSFNINDKLSIGVSIIGAYKELNYLKSIDISLYPKNISPTDTNYYYANWNSYEKVYMYDARILGKIGVRYRLNKIQFGLTFTSASYRVLGNSDSKRRISQSNIKNDDISYPDYILTESQNYLLSNIKDPFAISFGFMYSPNDKTRLYFSTEYFFAVDKYKLIDGTESIEDKNYDGTNFLNHYYQTKSVLNVGIGYQHVYSEKFEGLMGFKTDFNAYDLRAPYDIINNESIAQDNIDLYHFSVGVKTNYKKSSLVLGFNYSFGFENNGKQFANFTDVNMDGSNLLTGLQGERQNNMKVFSNSLGLYLGFSFGF